MISRVADHCFWFGRYLERAESTARVLAVTRALALDAELPAQAVLAAGGRSCRARRPTSRRASATTAAGQRRGRPALHDLGDENPVSLRTLDPRRARERALDPRGAVAGDLGGDQRALPVVRAATRRRSSTLQRPRRASTSTCGARRSSTLGPAARTMLHDDAARLHLARRAARARRPDRAHARHAPPHARRRRARQHEIVETALWLSLLRSCSGFEAFMRAAPRPRHRRSEVVVVPACSSAVPALAALLRSARRSRLMRDIWGDEASTDAANAIEVLASLDAWLERARARAAAASIHDLLTHVIDEIARVCGAIQQNIFGERAAPPQKVQAQQ